MTPLTHSVTRPRQGGVIGEVSGDELCLPIGERSRAEAIVCKTEGNSSFSIEDLEFFEDTEAHSLVRHRFGSHAVQSQVQFQDIDARLAEHAPLAAAGVLLD